MPPVTGPQWSPMSACEGGEGRGGVGGGARHTFNQRAGHWAAADPVRA